MKTTVSLLVLTFLCFSAYGHDWAGTWKVPIGNDPEICYPASPLVIEKSDSNYTQFIFRWQNSKPCQKDAYVAFQSEWKERADISSNTTKLKFYNRGWSFDRVFTINGDTITLNSYDKDDTLLTRVTEADIAKAALNWAGTYQVPIGNDTKNCYPASPIVVTENGTHATVKATWAKSLACAQMSSSEWTQTTHVTSDAFQIRVYTREKTYYSQIAIKGDTATFATEGGDPITLKRITEADMAKINWAGTYKVPMGNDTKNCYPASPLVITQNGSLATVNFTWANSWACGGHGEENQIITSHVSAEAFQIYRNITLKVEGDRVVYTPSAGDAINLPKITEADTANISWAGIYRVPFGGPSFTCYPASPIIITQVGTKATVHATSSNSLACERRELLGAIWDYTVDVSSEAIQLFYEQTHMRGQTRDVFAAWMVINANNTAVLTLRQKRDEKPHDPLILTKITEAEIAKIDWTGIWKVPLGDSGYKNCYPASPVIITQNGSKATAQGTWANSEACWFKGLKQIAWNVTTDVTSEGFQIRVEGSYGLYATLALNGEKAVFKADDGIPITLEKTSSQDLAKINWAGAYTLPEKLDEYSCYPASPVIITQNGTKATVFGTWQDSWACKNYKLEGLAWNQTTDVSSEAFQLWWYYNFNRFAPLSFPGWFKVKENTAFFSTGKSMHNEPKWDHPKDAVQPITLTRSALPAVEKIAS